MLSKQDLVKQMVSEGDDFLKSIERTAKVLGISTRQVLKLYVSKDKEAKERVHKPEVKRQNV